MNKALVGLNMLHFSTGEDTENNQLPGYKGPVVPLTPMGGDGMPRIGSWTPYVCGDSWISVPVKVSDETLEAGVWTATHALSGWVSPVEWCPKCYEAYSRWADEHE